ncbi:hypothetical protein [Marinivivus vitaminiproducens]|uniref:hypothetical protein n=1 Tax=Marinivivus vitaminiproducens TaxID=3035935 RepID=UPI0027A9791D|nr:hypothetical protein P4R82_06120 [Geminicoccaceae bacterium SCSIO 64248]
MLSAALAIGMIATTPGHADQAVMDALFERDHMRTVETPTTVVYDFVSGGEAVKGETRRDEIVMDVTAIREDGARDVHMTLFPGAGDKKQEIPGAPNGVHSNPVLWLLLKRDTEALQFFTGGAASYFQAQIRAAFEGESRAEPVTIELDGRQVEAARIRFQPFVHDEAHAKDLRNFKDKTYEIVLSDAVPGGLYRWHATTPGGSDESPPLLEETVTYRESRS